MRTPRPKKEIPLVIPPKWDDIEEWLVVGLDPSLSRTGFAISKMAMYDIQDQVLPPGKFVGHRWIEIGSLKPEDTKDADWIRSKMMALYVRDRTQHWGYDLQEMTPIPNVGLILCIEAPTPRNDYLNILNRIIQLVFFDTDFSQVFRVQQVLTINASTLRSCMGLTMRGASNKKENILKAYEYVDKDKWPSLDTDSCDAILLSIMGQYTAAINLGHPEYVPQRFLTSLCNATKEVKGAGTRQRIITKGILHRPEYWYPIERKGRTLCIKDAASEKSRLNREHFNL